MTMRHILSLILAANMLLPVSGAESGGGASKDYLRQKLETFEKNLDEMRNLPVSAASAKMQLSRLMKMGKGAPAPLEQYVLEAVCAGLVSIGANDLYVKIRPNLLDVSSFENKVLETCPACSGSGGSSMQCHQCHGSGKCPISSCENGRRVTPSLRGTSGLVVSCSTCKGTGKCPTCQGKGNLFVSCSKCHGMRRIVNKAAARELYQSLIAAAIADCQVKQGKQIQSTPSHASDNPTQRINDTLNQGADYCEQGQSSTDDIWSQSEGKARPNEAQNTSRLQTPKILDNDLDSYWNRAISENRSTNDDLYKKHCLSQEEIDSYFSNDTTTVKRNALLSRLWERGFSDGKHLRSGLRTLFSAIPSGTIIQIDDVSLGKVQNESQSPCFLVEYSVPEHGCTWWKLGLGIRPFSMSGFQTETFVNRLKNLTESGENPGLPPLVIPITPLTMKEMLTWEKGTLIRLDSALIERSIIGPPLNSNLDLWSPNATYRNFSEFRFLAGLNNKVETYQASPICSPNDPATKLLREFDSLSCNYSSGRHLLQLLSEGKSISLPTDYANAVSGQNHKFYFRILYLRQLVEKEGFVRGLTKAIAEVQMLVDRIEASASKQGAGFTKKLLDTPSYEKWELAGTRWGLSFKKDYYFDALYEKGSKSSIWRSDIRYYLVPFPDGIVYKVTNIDENNSVFQVSIELNKSEKPMSVKSFEEWFDELFPGMRSTTLYIPSTNADVAEWDVGKQLISDGWVLELLLDPKHESLVFHTRSRTHSKEICKDIVEGCLWRSYLERMSVEQ